MTKELDVAIEAAKAAGEVLREGFGEERTLRYKGEVDIVTEMDEQAERIISEVLRGDFPTTAYWPRRAVCSRGKETPAGSLTL